MKVIFKFTRYAQRRLRLTFAMGVALALHVGLLSFSPSSAATMSRPRVAMTIVTQPKKIDLPPPSAPVAAPIVQKKITKAIDAPPPAAEAIAVPVAQPVAEPTTVVAATSESAAVVAVAGGGNNANTGASVGSAAAPSAPAPRPGPSAADVSNMMGQYSGWVHARVDGLKHYPLQARRMHIEGVTKVLIRVARNGQLVGEPRIISSSHPILDAEALRIISQAAPFPALPRGTDDSVEFTIPVSFAFAT